MRRFTSPGLEFGPDRRPLPDGVEDRLQRLSLVGERVGDLRRPGGYDDPRHDALALQLAKTFGQQAVADPGHRLPSLYTAAADTGEAVTFPYEGIDMGSMSMRCVRIG